MANYKLGKKPARKGAIRFAFADYFNLAEMPRPPVKIGHWNIGEPWGMFANDQFGNCVWAGAAHEHMMWAKAGLRPRCVFTDQDVLGVYSEVTGFKPGDDSTDQGTDMAVAAEFRRKTGIPDEAGARHKIDSYVSIKPGHADMLALATYLTGAVGVGLMLPNSAMEQFDAQKPWTVEEHDGGSAGGHYVSCIGRNSNGDFLVISWGRIHAMSPAFLARYNDESVCFLSLDSLRGKLSPEGFDLDTLRRHLSQIDVKEASRHA